MIRRLAIALMPTPLLLTLQAVAAAAAPPSNDTFAGATPVMPGFSEELDTSEATTDADDAQLDGPCGATDASVWYALTAVADTGVIVDVSQSSYSAGVVVGVGTQGNLDLVACGSTRVGFFVAAGTTFYVLAVDTQLDGGGNGGTLRISFNESPLPTVDVTIDPVGRVNARTGIATINGTYTCIGDRIDVEGEVRRDVGQHTIHGLFGFSDLSTCDGTTRSWSAEVFPDNGRFAGGKAVTVTTAFSCNFFECDGDVEERTVQLRGGPT
jgi:hypothetical protein